jgi:hypothetical protein
MGSFSPVIRGIHEKYRRTWVKEDKKAIFMGNLAKIVKY